MPHPPIFLKWAGGKSQSLQRIDGHIPKTIGSFYEPFVGGGSVLLHVLASLQSGARVLLPEGRLVAADINPSLINVYRTVQNAHVQLNAELQTIYTAASNACENNTLKEYFYALRSVYNQHKSEHTPYVAALFIFLNHNCFRGLYRENKSGEFNVPYGHYKVPIVPSADIINAAHELFTLYPVEFKCQNAGAFLEEYNDAIGPDDVVFLDPPYEKITPNTFVAYYAGGVEYNFSHLCNWIYQGREQQRRIIMTNHATPELLQQFGDFPVCETFSARRAIHAARPESRADELIVCTLPPME